jgi:hypothetical protein
LRSQGCPWTNRYSLKLNPTQYYTACRWLQRHDDIQWEQSTLQWLDEIDLILPSIVIPDLSSLIKCYI